MLPDAGKLGESKSGNGESSSVEAKLKLRQMRSGAVQPLKSILKSVFVTQFFKKQALDS